MPSNIRNDFFYIVLFSIGVLLLYLLAPVLTPFLFGALLAYLANPLVKKLESWKISHLLSVIIVFLLLFGALALLILMMVPLVQVQFVAFLEMVPKILSWTQEVAIPWLKEYVNPDAVKSALSTKSLSMFTTVIKSGSAIIEIIVYLVLIPVVTFYLLRDWDLVLKSVKNVLPHSVKTNVIKLAKECDEVLSAFFRGQFLVMIALSLIYGTGLTFIGLNGGFAIGIIGGALSIIPYLGSIVVVVLASLTALIQFNTWDALIWVLVVYAIGQAMEGYVLTPYFVGNRIGLHPVAVIFAIMAGGTLFGFVGVLLALPVAAVIMVMLRFLQKNYVTHQEAR